MDIIGILSAGKRIKLDHKIKLVPPVEINTNFREVFHFNYFRSYDSDASNLLYLRSSTLYLFHQLAEKTFLIVLGSPGIGKSITVWTWLCTRMTSAPSGRSAMWVSLPEESAVKFSDGEMSRCCGKFEESMIADIDVLVLDGLKSSDWNSWFGLALRACSSGCKVILVTSAQVKVDEGQVLRKGGSQVLMQPWSLEEYQEACKYDPFFQRVVGNLGGTVGASYSAEEKSDLVERKYATSGFSARWTFDITEEKAVESSITAIDRCSDPRALLNGIQGSRSTDAVNHLVFSFGAGKSAVVSSFVCRKLAAKCDRQFIVAAYHASAMTNNPAFDGWVLELDVLYHIRKDQMANKVKVLGTDGQFLDRDDSFQCSEVIEFVDRFFDSADRRTRYPVHCWFIPRKFNNGGFDAVQLRCEGGQYRLRFLQVTRAKTHGLKLHFMKSFADAFNAAVDEDLRATAVEIVIVTAMHSAKDFVIPTHAQVVGSLSEYSWSLCDLIVAGFDKTLFDK